MNDTINAIQQFLAVALIIVMAVAMHQVFVAPLEDELNDCKIQLFNSQINIKTENTDWIQLIYLNGSWHTSQNQTIRKIIWDDRDYINISNMEIPNITAFSIWVNVSNNTLLRMGIIDNLPSDYFEGKMDWYY